MEERWNICQHLKQLKNGEYQRDEYRYFVVKAVCQAFQNLDICGNWLEWGRFIFCGTGETKMRLDGFGIFVDDMPKMIRFYRDVLGFEIKEAEDAVNVYLIKDGTLFMLYERKNFEKMTNRKYEYLKGLNGHFEIALYVDTFEEVDKSYHEAVAKGAVSVLEPTTEPWGQRTCYIADPESNLIEIGSFNKSFEEIKSGFNGVL